MCHPDNETVSVILLFRSSPFLNAQLMKVGHSVFSYPSHSSYIMLLYMNEGTMRWIH